MRLVSGTQHSYVLFRCRGCSRYTEGSDSSRKTDMTKARASKVEVKYFGKPACWEVAKEMLMNDARMLLILLIYNQI